MSQLPNSPTNRIALVPSDKHDDRWLSLNSGRLIEVEYVTVEGQDQASRFAELTEAEEAVARGRGIVLGDGTGPTVNETAIASNLEAFRTAYPTFTTKVLEQIIATAAEVQLAEIDALEKASKKRVTVLRAVEIRREAIARAAKEAADAAAKKE